MKRSLYFILMGVFCFGILAALADEPSLSVSIDKERVVIGDAVRLTLSLQGATSSHAPELPPIPDFEVQYVGASMQSFTSMTVIIQGKKVEEKRSGGGVDFEYALTPKRVGTLTIPRFSFMLDEKRYSTSEPFVIQVSDFTETQQDVFLKVSVDKETLYLGESALLTFEWYFDKDIQDYSLKIPWYGSLKDFLVEDPKQDPQAQHAQIIINDKEKMTAEKKNVIYQGKRYTVLSFQKILTPIAQGTYTLDPAFLKALVVKGYESSRMEHVPFFRYYSDFDQFFNRGRRAVTDTALSRSKPVAIAVRPLPETNKPVTFTGAVGSFDFQVTLSPEKVQRGEPVTVTMKVIGSGNFNEVQLPDFPEPSAFKGYTPEIKTDTSNADGLVIGEKTFTKVLVGRREGKYEIPSLSFAYFDPTKEKYETLTRGPFPIEVLPGTGQEEPVRLASPPPVAVHRGKEIKVLTQDIRYIKTDLGKLEGGRPPLYQSSLFWYLGFGPLPLFTSLSFLIQRRRKRFQEDIAFARRTHAFKKAQKELTESRRYLSGGNADAFYATLSKALLDFLADKLNRPLGGIPFEAADLLKERKVDEVLLSDLRHSLERLDLAKFSAVRGDLDEMQKLFGNVEKLIFQFEKVIR
ncbi:MAG: protein BatD [Candidatus Omnitrophica bacterium]|nr:protein BatD [Candidatus Omnitrophota bacterium]